MPLRDDRPTTPAAATEASLPHLPCPHRRPLVRSWARQRGWSGRGLPWPKQPQCRPQTARTAHAERRPHAAPRSPCLPAGVFQVRPGYYQAALQVAGERIRESGTDPQALGEWYAEQKRKARRGRFEPGLAQRDRELLRDYLPRWLAGRRGTVSAKHWDNHGRHAAMVALYLGSLPLRALRADDLRGLYARLQAAPDADPIGRGLAPRRSASCTAPSARRSSRRSTTESSSATRRRWSGCPGCPGSSRASCPAPSSAASGRSPATIGSSRCGTWPASSPAGPASCGPCAGRTSTRTAARSRCGAASSARRTRAGCSTPRPPRRGPARAWWS